MGIDEILGPKREQILAIAAKHGVTNIRVLGSVARGEAGPESDVDLLVEYGPKLQRGFPRASSPTWRNFSAARST